MIDTVVLLYIVLFQFSIQKNVEIRYINMNTGGDREQRLCYSPRGGSTINYVPQHLPFLNVFEIDIVLI